MQAGMQAVIVVGMQVGILLGWVLIQAVTIITIRVAEFTPVALALGSATAAWAVLE
jgi:hypothetical protein